METHILFFILAGVLIAVLIGYSIWSARREKSRVFSNTFTTRPPSAPINNEITADIPASLNTQGMHTYTSAHQETPTNDMTQVQQDVQENVSKIRISLQDQPQNAPDSSYQTSSFEQASFEAQPQPEVQLNESSASQQMQQAAEPSIVTLYVVAPEGTQFRGDVVVQNLEALGFLYGEYQIFHRHLDNPASPVLFSVANMMQPGVFDLAKIEQFATVGLVFFMHLPSAGNDLANLKLMIRTVESFAQSVGGFILDEQQQLFDDEKRQHYLLRVKS